MAMGQRRKRILLGLCGAVLATFGLVGAGEAANCGDTAGPRRSRVPCACGDTVVTNTRLRSADPVVTNICDSLAIQAALVIGGDGIALDCAGLKIRGGTEGHGIGLTGILIQDRNRVTVRSCQIEFFFDGIASTGRGNRLLSNKTSQTVDGFFVKGDSTWAVGNRAEHCEARGIFVSSGKNIAISNNRVARCLDGIVFEGERSSIGWNILTENRRHGVVVPGQSNHLYYNMAFGNGDVAEVGTGHGFQVEGTGNAFLGNTANESEGKGFCVVEGNVNIGLNVALDNHETPQTDFDCQAD